MFYYKPAKNGQWRWAMISSNGEQTSSNETHPTRSNAKRAAYKHALASARQVCLQPVYPCLLSSFIMKEWHERPGAKNKPNKKTK